MNISEKTHIEMADLEYQHDLIRHKILEVAMREIQKACDRSQLTFRHDTETVLTTIKGRITQSKEIDHMIEWYSDIFGYFPPMEYENQEWTHFYE